MLKKHSFLLLLNIILSHLLILVVIIFNIMALIDLEMWLCILHVLGIEVHLIQQLTHVPVQQHQLTGQFIDTFSTTIQLLQNSGFHQRY